MVALLQQVSSMREEQIAMLFVLALAVAGCTTAVLCVRLVQRRKAAERESELAFRLELVERGYGPEQVQAYLDGVAPASEMPSPLRQTVDRDDRPPCGTPAPANLADGQFAIDPERAMIAGVCAAMADHFGLDVTLVRVGWLVGLAMTMIFPLVPVYYAIYLIAPKIDRSAVAA